MTNRIQREVTDFMTEDQASELEDILNEAGKAFAMRQEDVKNLYKTMNQILNSGRVTTEDFRMQFCEYFPGAYALLSKSMGLPREQLKERLVKSIPAHEFTQALIKALKPTEL